MGIEKNLPVHGSVIQRSIIPEGLGAVLNIATVPVAELDRTYLENDSNKNFRRLVGQVLGIPTESMIDDKQYSQLSKYLRDGRLWEEMSMRARDPYTERLFRSFYFFWLDIAKETEYEQFRLSRPDSHTEIFGIHSLALMMSPTANTGVNIGAPFPFHLYWRKNQLKLVDEMDITEEAFQLGFSCYFSSISSGESVFRFIKSAGNYDIPSGQSPATRSDNLKTIIETTKKVCLAPIAVGGTTAISQLSQCNYVSALLATGTGAAMTLILVGTVSVADYLVHYLLHKRNSLEIENDGHKQLER